MVSTKKIAIANDRAGVAMKNFLITHLRQDYPQLMDLGSSEEGEIVDYPDYARLVVEALQQKKTNYGVLICGTGIGMSIAANRFKGIRASLCHSSWEAQLTREHNDANIICLGARIIGNECALENVRTFLQTSFAGGRHKIRVEKLDQLV
jgi:ribose 5-phosphate isomerase B